MDQPNPPTLTKAMSPPSGEYQGRRVSALLKEVPAEGAMLNEEHEDSRSPTRPKAYGTVLATMVSRMLRILTTICFRVIAGIRGGITGLKDCMDVRCGDMVVSQPNDTDEGEVQHDVFGKGLGTSMRDNPYQSFIDERVARSWLQRFDHRTEPSCFLATTTGSEHQKPAFKSYSSMFYPGPMLSGDGVPRWRVRKTHAPFVPYVEKLIDTDDRDYSAPALPFVRPNEKWIDLDIIRGWLRTCDEFHGQQCRVLARCDTSKNPGPAWLIDVHRLCVVAAQSEMSYFALSYVWGRSSASCALKANISLLKRDNALDNSTAIIHVPKTIAHSIQLVKLLGERYLWVDRFCIIQDDGPAKQVQLDSMWAIYADAIATIVAARGNDAEDGLKGIRGVTGCRHFGGDLSKEEFPWTKALNSLRPLSSPAASNLRENDLDFDDSTYNSISSLPADARNADSPDPQENEPQSDDSVYNCIWTGPPDDRNTDTPDPFDYKPPLFSECAFVRTDTLWETDSSPEIPELWDSESNSEIDIGCRSMDPIQPSRSELQAEQARSLMRSSWYSRGWTFQEQLFSPRKIIFQDETVNWECVCSAWHESDGPGQTITPLPDAKQRVTESFECHDIHFSDLFRFARLVTLYNQRQFTYPEDVVDAFAGVISKLTPGFTGGFIAGLPQMFFDSALLWQPCGPVHRRSKRGSPEHTPCMPSWSWFGWHGELSSESWRSAHDYMRNTPVEYFEKDGPIWQQTSWLTISTVKWFRIDDAGEKHPIAVSGQDYRQSCLSAVAETVLPAGWSRHDCPITGKPFFRHQREASREFWYPIPLGAPAPQAPYPHVLARFLWCRTRRAVVRVGDVFWNQETSKCLCADLLDDAGTWIGALRYKFKSQGWEELLPPLYDKHELIELSAGSVLDQETEEVSFDEWFRPGCPRRTGKYEFYNVMAIVWIGQIAYRQAVGRVVKAAWETLATQEFEITLG